MGGSEMALYTAASVRQRGPIKMAIEEGFLTDLHKNRQQ